MMMPNQIRSFWNSDLYIFLNRANDYNLVKEENEKYTSLVNIHIYQILHSFPGSSSDCLNSDIS